jgi:energy-coupling factor transport system ATP-binding protein
VKVLGRDTRQAHISEIARQVGLVFQNPEHQLFAPTVWDEAIFAPHNFGMLDEAVQGRTKELLQRCGLEGRESDPPYRLSYGQKRRLNLISILNYRPAVILLDEILIGQDAANASFLLNLLSEHAADGGAVVMVNHNPEATYRYASRLLFLSDGRILVDGPVEEGFHRLEQLGKRAYLPWGWPNMEEAA